MKRNTHYSEYVKRSTVKYCMENPTKSVAYASTSEAHGKEFIKEIKQLLERAGMDFEPELCTHYCIAFKSGGKVMATIGGPGRGLEYAATIIDDTIKHYSIFK